MSDAGRLYQAILKNLFDLFPDMLEDNVVTLAMMVTGILGARSGQLTKMASKVSYPDRKTSLVDRFRRMVKNENIIVDVAFNPVAQLFLSCLSATRVVLRQDKSNLPANWICRPQFLRSSPVRSSSNSAPTTFCLTVSPLNI